MKAKKIKSFVSFVRLVTKLNGKTVYDGQGTYNMYTPDADWDQLVFGAKAVADKLKANDQLESVTIKELKGGFVVKIVVRAKKSAMEEPMYDYYRTLEVTKRYGMQVSF